MMHEEEAESFTPIDHSQDVEVRKGNNGKLFGIKNIRQEFADNNKMILVADITGDKESADCYLKTLVESMKATMQLNKDNSSLYSIS